MRYNLIIFIDLFIYYENYQNIGYFKISLNSEYSKQNSCLLLNLFKNC